MTYQELALAAIDKAYQGHIQRLYDVLAAAPEADWQSGIAMERYTTGYRRAISTREAAIKTVA